MPPSISPDALLRASLLLAAAWSTFVGCEQRGGGDLPDVTLVAPAVGGSPAGGSNDGGAARIGDRCTADADCQTGLCLRAGDADAVLTTGTAPGGLCTAPCATGNDCQALDDEAVCVGFETGGYCVQSCRFGDPPPGDDKCARRPELSCQPTLTAGGPACDDASPCPPPLLCFEGACSLLPACLPRCNSDLDCPADRYCNPRDGECVTQRPTGKLPGELCDPDASEDECRGHCLRMSDDEESAECDETCTVGAQGGCGYSDALSAPVVCAFYAYDLGPQGLLDEGSCANLCRCNEECPGEQLCMPDPGDTGLGVCVRGLTPDESKTECPAE